MVFIIHPIFLQTWENFYFYLFPFFLIKETFFETQHKIKSIITHKTGARLSVKNTFLYVQG